MPIKTGICLCAFLVSLTTVMLLLRFWKLPYAVDQGDLFRKSQGTPILRVGGLAILLGLIFAVVLAKYTGVLPAGDQTPVTLMLCGAMFLIGFADDLHPLPAALRLAGQCVVALVAYLLGFQITGIDLPFLSRIELGGSAMPLTILWLVGLPNIFNLSDGMDGLAGGLGVTVFAVIGTASLTVGNTDAAFLAFAMAASIGGFLLFNLPPAKVYLGDGGAYLIGFYAALLAVQSSQKGTTAAVLLMVIAVLAYPMADTAFAMCRRFIYGFPIFRSDAEHLHHRMVTLGLPRGWLLTLFYGVFMCLALAGLGMLLNRGLMLPVFTGLLGLLILAALYARAYCPQLHQLPERIRLALKARRQVRYAIRLAQVLEHELDFTSDADVFWESFGSTLRKTGLRSGGTPTLMDSDEWTSFSIKLGTTGYWNLNHPKTTEIVEWNWKKIAQCFVPCLSEALKRFPPQAQSGVHLPDRQLDENPQRSPAVSAA